MQQVGWKVVRAPSGDVRASAGGSTGETRATNRRASVHALLIGDKMGQLKTGVQGP